MRALITNDDGIHTTGVLVLAQAAVAAGLEVVVAAPHQERSGTGTSLSALEEGGRLLVDERDLPGLEGVPAYAVHATPAFIPLVAALGAFGEPPELVLSGINHGPNTGRVTLHSGTVGAALTAASQGVPALAVSLDINSGTDPVHWETARRATDEALTWFLKHADEPYVLNVNVPNVEPDALRGLRPATLGGFGAVQAAIGERGEGYVTVTFTGTAEPDVPGTDVALLHEGWATVTAMNPPAQVPGLDLTGLS